MILKDYILSYLTEMGNCCHGTPEMYIVTSDADEPEHETAPPHLLLKPQAQFTPYLHHPTGNSNAHISEQSIETYTLLNNSQTSRVYGSNT